MYSMFICGVIVSMNGTGLAGSLTYSSKPSPGLASSGAANCSASLREGTTALACVAFGGQASNVRQLFEPVSKTVASAGSGQVFVLQIFLEKRQLDFLAVKRRRLGAERNGPSLSPATLAQPP